MMEAGIADGGWYCQIVLAVLPGGGKAEHGAKFQLKLPSFQRSASGANAVSPRASSWSAAATVKDGMWNVLIPRRPIRVTPESVAPTSTFICTTLGATAENAIGTVPKMARVKFCAQLARILAERRQGFGQAKARRSRTWAARPLARS